MMKRRAAVPVFLVLVLSAQVIAAEGERPPNIIVILADDLGYECIGANGSQSYKTPVLDRLAATGMRFTHCYSQPLCTPTRVQLLTGLYNKRNYIRFGLLDPQATTFAQIFRQAGYATCVAGKWQLSGGVDAPKQFGFDEYFLWQLTVRKSRYSNPVLEKEGRIIEYTNGEYGPELICDYLVDFITRHKDRPFLAFYPMMLTHSPYEPTPDSPDYDRKLNDETRGRRNPKYFGGMVEYMDKNVGRILERLDALKIRENTLVIFTGDNGTGVGVTSRIADRDFPGGKGQTTDAGMHVPLIVNWPGRIPAGRINSSLIDSTDFFPTMLEAAGVTRPATLALDGQTFFPQLMGHPGEPRDAIYCWYSRNGGATGAEFAANHQFKLYADGRLFDIAKDPRETSPLPESNEIAGAAQARMSLRKVLDEYKEARPQSISEQGRRNRGEK
ncbi:MAG: sulfatase-like hydrolase/transferase [Planctomycetaceae bacterium]